MRETELTTVTTHPLHVLQVLRRTRNLCLKLRSRLLERLELPRVLPGASVGLGAGSW